MRTGDSGGTPWQGRDLPAGPFAGDDGAPDPALFNALDVLVIDPATEARVVAALAQARLFVPVVAVTEPGADAQMAVLTVTGADGRRALPVFSCVASLARWRPDARPVPVPGSRAALSAVAEGCDLLDLDPAGPVPYRIRRPAVWALGRGLAWMPSYADPDLAREITALCREEGVSSVCEPGTGAELRVVLGLPREIVGERREQLIARLSRRFAASQRFADSVDSLEITVAAVAGPGSLG